MKDFVALDLETTGLTNDDEIIEIGLVRIRNGKITDKFSTLVRPEKKISKEITELTGIEQRMLDEAPLISDVIDKTYEFIGKDIIVGHNVEFDINFINRFVKIENEFIDTLKLTKIFYPFSHTHSLGTIARYLGIEVGREHRALEDAITSAMIILRMNEDIKNIDAKTLFSIIDVLPGSPERNYIKNLLKENNLTSIYNYEIPEEHSNLKDGDNEILLEDPFHKELFENLLDNKITIFEAPIMKELNDFSILPIIKFVKEKKEKFLIVKDERIGELFKYLKKLSKEFNISLNVSFINSKESYICLEKFNEIKTLKTLNMDPFTVASLIFWLSKTKTGNLNEVKNVIKDDAIKINVDENCRFEECRFYNTCFYFNMLKMERESEIVITNYTNFFRSNLDYKNVLFIDADEIEERGTQGFSIIIDFKTIDYILKRIIEDNPNNEKFKYAHSLLKENFTMLGKDIIKNYEKFRNGIILSEYKERFIFIIEIIADVMENLNNSKDMLINRLYERLNYLLFMDNDYVLKVNTVDVDDPLSFIYIFYPVEVWNRIGEKIMNIERSIFISRTITTSFNFDFFIVISGIKNMRDRIKTILYDLKKDDFGRFKIYFATYIPPHNSDEFNRHILSMLNDVFKGFKKSYVMFPSYTSAEKVYDLIEDKKNFVKHAKYKSLKNILKDEEDYIVLGTTHLFDRVKEKKFEILVIPKIPFPNMSDEVIKKRIEALSKYGFDTFTNYLLPIAILKIKKSILKLMNLSFDKCAIIILDRRIFEKDYSSIITDSLPGEFEKIESNDELREKLMRFFNG